MYIVKKDGLYLMNYMFMGVMGIDNNGNLKSIPTGYYSSRRRDAMIVESKEIANALGDTIITVSGKKE